MITQDMTYEQRTNILREASRQVGRRGFIAGGYVRDALFMKVPKDLDVFAKIPENVTREGILNKARLILTQFGHEVDEAAFDAHEDQYGNINNGKFICVKSLPKEDNPWGPVDVIFHSNLAGRRDWFVSDHFDLDICKCYMDSNHNPVILPEAQRMFIQGDQRILSGVWANNYDPKALKARLDHLREKYPQLKLVWAAGLTGMSGVTYERYLKEGAIGDPRAVLQEEAEGVAGNEVRLQAGAAIRDIGVILDEMQGFQNQVHNNQDVQPGLRIDAW